MIRDKKLKLMSLVVSLVGIVIIYIVSMLAGKVVVQIGTISNDDVGKYVIANATINSISTNNGNTFLEIHDSTGKINVVVFERTSRNLNMYNFKEGDTVLVEGQINTYKGGLEIIANSIKRL